MHCQHRKFCPRTRHKHIVGEYVEEIAPVCPCFGHTLVRYKVKVIISALDYVPVR